MTELSYLLNMRYLFIYLFARYWPIYFTMMWVNGMCKVFSNIHGTLSSESAFQLFAYSSAMAKLFQITKSNRIAEITPYVSEVHLES